MENINYILAYKALTEYTDVIRAMMEQVAEEGEEVTYMNTDLYQALLNYVLTKYSGSEDKNIAEDIDYRISVTQKIKKDLEMISYMSEDTAIEVIKKVLDEFLDYIEFIFTKCEIIEEKRGASHNILVTQPMLKSDKESIQSVCNQEYCIIFKSNNYGIR